jgi:hypothetical protein
MKGPCSVPGLCAEEQISQKVSGAKLRRVFIAPRRRGFDAKAGVWAVNHSPGMMLQGLATEI